MFNSQLMAVGGALILNGHRGKQQKTMFAEQFLQYTREGSFFIGLLGDFFSPAPVEGLTDNISDMMLFDVTDPVGTPDRPGLSLRDVLAAFRTENINKRKLKPLKQHWPHDRFVSGRNPRIAI
jgi:hypothetical protein